MLGMGGRLVRVYAALIGGLWYVGDEEREGEGNTTRSDIHSTPFYSPSTSTSYDPIVTYLPPLAPRALKQTLSQYAPQFTGYHQHDSQELVAFLLDGLHEDVNRGGGQRGVVVFPDPIWREDEDEKEESEEEDESDQNTTNTTITTKRHRRHLTPTEHAHAQHLWHLHHLRNDSHLVHLFQGQLRSRVGCGVCRGVSVTFDPFLYLSLPLVFGGREGGGSGMGGREGSGGGRGRKKRVSFVWVPYMHKGRQETNQQQQQQQDERKWKRRRYSWWVDETLSVHALRRRMGEQLGVDWRRVGADIHHVLCVVLCFFCDLCDLLFY